MITWNDKSLKRDGKVINTKDLRNYLWEPINISGNVCVRDMLDVIKSDGFWLDVIGEWALYDHLMAAHKATKQTKLSNPWITSVHFEWVCEQLCHDGYQLKFMDNIVNVPKTDDLSWYLSASGVKRGSKTRRTLSVTDMRHIMDAKIRVNPKVILHRRIDGNFIVPESIGNLYPTLILVFRTFCHELCFYGDIEDKKVFFRSLDETSKGIKKGRIKTKECKIERL